MTIKISIVTDEVSADLESALELAQTWNLDGVELRGIGGDRYPNLPDYWSTRVPELVAEAGLPVVAISPGLFKIPFPQIPSPSTRILRWEDEMFYRRFRDAERLARFHLEELLPASIQAAKDIGSPVIVAFSFDRNENVSATTPVPQEVIDVLKDAAQKVQEAGLTLAIEVEHICWGDIGLRTAEIIRKLDNPAAGINWDPANAYRAGMDRPFPEDYEAVRNFVRHVHYKDAGTNPETGERGFVFDGEVDWSGQVAALKRDGYDGYISVETHVRPKIEMAKRSIERLRKLLEEA